jgi:hypothetical protein
MKILSPELRFPVSQLSPNFELSTMRMKRIDLAALLLEASPLLRLQFPLALIPSTLILEHGLESARFMETPFKLIRAMLSSTCHAEMKRIELASLEASIFVFRYSPSFRRCYFQTRSYVLFEIGARS